MDTLQPWLYQPPGYTTFRVNTMKQFNHNNIEDYFRAQSKKLNTRLLPNVYFLRDDCLVIGKWSQEVEIEKNCKEVVVDALCAAAVLRGSHIFAPGVLGLPTNCKLDETIDIYGDLDGNCKKGLKVQYDGKKVYVGTGLLKMLRCDLFRDNVQPSGIAVHTLLPASRLPVINESLYPKGVILLQNLPSIVCGWVVDAQPCDKILDMCASPGNKTTHLAEMSKDKATIIALDKTEAKVDKIKLSCEIQGVTCVKSYAFDSRKCCSETPNENGGPPFAPNSFDKVLLDAPCSGLGQRPQLVNRMNPKVQESYKFVQRQLFDAAVKLVKVGGTLIYSTCTITKAENEEMVAWVLEKHPTLQLTPAEPLLGGPGLPNCGLSDEQRIMVQRFGPEDDPLRLVDPIYKDTIGFFIAKFTKL